MMRSSSVRTALNYINLGAGVGETDSTYTGMCRLMGHDFAIPDPE